AADLAGGGPAALVAAKARAPQALETVLVDRVAVVLLHLPVVPELEHQPLLDDDGHGCSSTKSCCPRSAWAAWASRMGLCSRWLQRRADSTSAGASSEARCNPKKTVSTSGGCRYSASIDSSSARR